MTSVGKHRGWLLVYEIQYWLLVVGSIVGSLWLGRTNTEIVAPLLVNVPVWGIPVYSLYRSTAAVRAGHIVWCWVVASGFVTHAFFVSAGSVVNAAVFVAWALYWQRSDRVRQAYPAPIPNPTAEPANSEDG